MPAEKKIFNKALEEIVYEKIKDKYVFTKNGVLGKRGTLLRVDPQGSYIFGKDLYASAKRLMWLHFKGKIPHGSVITTKNGNKQDVKLSNLIMTNMKGAVRLGMKRAAA